MGSLVKKRNDTSSKQKFKKAKKLEPKVLTTGIYKGLEYDSLDELSILQWLFELKAVGYIKSIQRATSYLLSDSLQHNYVQQMKRVSSRPMVQTLMHGHSYTPEFEIEWDYKKSKNKFVWDKDDPTRCKFDKLFIGRFEEDRFMTYVEVKPAFDRNNMERLFKLNQKWMWDKYEIFVNLIKVKDLFPDTFTPKEYHRTPSGKIRILKWPKVSLTEFLYK